MNIEHQQIQDACKKIMAITALSATLGFTMIGGELARPVHAASASNAANVSSVFKN
ncbi:hypothetical protein ACFSQ7_34375 [Paenibacillus rhizoplanae]